MIWKFSLIHGSAIISAISCVAVTVGLPPYVLDVSGEDVRDRAAVGREVVIAEGAGLIALVGEDQLPGELRLLVAGHQTSETGLGHHSRT